MSSTIETAGAYDALEKAKPGEPIFVLLGRDVAGPGALTEWARLRRNNAFRKHGDTENPRDKEILLAELKQAANAEEIAEQFAEYRKNEVIPSEAAGRASYNDVIKSTEELLEAENRTKRSMAERHLREAAYNFCEARDALLDLGLIGEAGQIEMETMLARINAIADEHTAKRPNFAAEPSLPLGGAE